MKILAIDSSGLTASVSVVTRTGLIGEFTVNFKKTHSQTLLPMIQNLLKILDMEVSEMDAIAVSAGPGSFTGLRIGAATAKGIGMALDCPLIPIPTTAALAYNMAGATQLICPIMDARRNQVYTGLYRFEKGEMITVVEQKAVDIMEILREINLLEQEVIFVGDGIPVYEELIRENVKTVYSFAPLHNREQRASSLGFLAINEFEKGNYVSSDEFEIIYLRKAQAEREYDEKNKMI